MLWQNESTEVKVTAYAPYSQQYTQGKPLAETIELNQTSGEGGQKADLLYASASVTPNSEENSDNDIYYDKNSKALNVKMNHVMSKLKVNIRYATELTQNNNKPQLTEVILSDTKTKYSFDLNNGKVTAPQENQQLNRIKMMLFINTADEGYNDSAEAILVPQTNDFNIYVTVNSRTFRYQHNRSCTFSGGNTYTLNLLVGHDITNIGTITASAWSSNESGNLTTE